MSIVFDYADIASRMRGDDWHQPSQHKSVFGSLALDPSPSVINDAARQYIVSQANSRNGLGLAGALGQAKNLYAANSLNSLYQGLSKSNV